MFLIFKPTKINTRPVESLIYEVPYYKNPKCRKSSRYEKSRINKHTPETMNLVVFFENIDRVFLDSVISARRIFGWGWFFLDGLHYGERFNPSLHLLLDE